MGLAFKMKGTQSFVTKESYAVAEILWVLFFNFKPDTVVSKLSTI